MKGVFYINDLHELYCLKDKNTEIIICPEKLSRFGKLSNIEAREAIEYCWKNKILAFLEWDILMSQNEFEQVMDTFHYLPLEKISAVRVQDIGGYNYLLESTNLDIHLILESGNHNLVGIKKWENIANGRLKRIILGIELPKETIKKYIQVLKTPCELQVLGKILLFYSPRSLMKKPLEISSDYFSARASSEETPHKGFSMVENTHGTFMFLPKDQFLLDVYPELQDTGLQYVRLDHRFLEGDIKLDDIIDLFKSNSTNRWSDFKKSYAGKFIRGYFNVNRSDAIFPKLKNSRNIKKNENYIGKVVDVKKDHYLALSIFKNNKRTLSIGDEIEISSPDGRVKKVQLKSMRNTGLHPINTVNGENIVLIPHVGGISVKSQVNFIS